MNLRDHVERCAILLLRSRAFRCLPVSLAPFNAVAPPVFCAASAFYRTARSANRSGNGNDRATDTESERQRHEGVFVSSFADTIKQRTCESVDACDGACDRRGIAFFTPTASESINALISIPPPAAPVTGEPGSIPRSSLHTGARQSRRHFRNSCRKRGLLHRSRLQVPAHRADHNAATTL